MSFGLEGQIVRAFSFGCRCRSCKRSFVGGCCGGSGCRCANGTGGCCRRGCLHAYRGRVNLANVIGADAVEPTAIVFTGIDVEEHLYFLTNLYVKTAQTVFAKDREYHFVGI